VVGAPAEAPANSGSPCGWETSVNYATKRQPVGHPARIAVQVVHSHTQRSSEESGAKNKKLSVGGRSMHATLSRRSRHINGQGSAPAPTSNASAWSRCLTTVRGLFGSESAPLAGGLSSRIRQFDATADPKAWSRCRDAGWYHQSRARRAIDREDWTAAEMHAREALEWDDTRAANLLTLGEILMRREMPDLRGARQALESAFDCEPANSYVIDRLCQVYRALGDSLAQAAMLRRALAAGAQVQTWEPELNRLQQPILLAS
jgi:predicted Zn-dependent protease